MRKILAIDDSPIVTRILSSYFSARQFAIETMNTSFGVTNRIRDWCPDVILMDLDMPGLSGDKLLKLLKETGGAEGVMIILVSSDEERMRNAMESGLASGFYVKGQPLALLEKLILQ